MDGSQAAIAALRPVITERNPALGTEIDWLTRFPQRLNPQGHSA